MKEKRDHLRKRDRRLLKEAIQNARLETYSYRMEMSPTTRAHLKIYLDTWVIGLIQSVLDGE